MKMVAKAGKIARKRSRNPKRVTVDIRKKPGRMEEEIAKK